MSNSSASSQALLTGEQALAAMEQELRRRHRARLSRHAETIEAWGRDFIAFARELDVIDKDGVRVRVEPTPMLRQFEGQRSGRDIALKPRQVFFTTWELARDLWWLLTQGAAHAVVLCQSDKDNRAILEITQRANVMLGLDALGTGAGLVGRHPWLGSLLRWERSELRFGPARLEIKGAGASAAAARKVGRSGTVQRLHITEISSFEFAHDTWTAIQPTVPTGLRNEVTIESTAHGAGGLFYELYQGAREGRNSYAPFFFAWMRHHEYRLPLHKGEQVTPSSPREREMVKKHGADAGQIKWYRVKVADLGSQDRADQEYPVDEETCWLVAGRLFLDPERTKVLLTETTDPMRVETIRSSVPDASVRCEIRTWADAEGHEEYIVVADPSEGVVGGDPAAAAVYRRATGEHVASVHGLFRTWEFASVLAQLGRRYNNASIVVERINHGHAVLQALSLKENYPRIYHDEDERPGWKTGQVQRATAMESFEAAHRTGGWTTPDRDALAEMQRFVVGPTGKPAAAPGAHDDRVIVHVIAVSILSRPHSLGTNTVSGSGSRWGSEERGYG